MAFPTSPTDGQIYNDYIYNSTNKVWKKYIMMDDDPWHLIGTTGEPPFENGYVDYSDVWGRSAFRKTPSGIVYMRGLVTSGTPGDVIFTLPVGYRPELSGPTSGLHVATVDSSWNSTTAPSDALLYINTSGVVYFGAGGGSTWGSLAVSFNIGPQSV